MRNFAVVLAFGLGFVVGAIGMAHHIQQEAKPITFQCSHAQWEGGECEPETVTCYRMADGHVVCAQGVN